MVRRMFATALAAALTVGVAGPGAPRSRRPRHRAEAAAKAGRRSPPAPEGLPNNIRIEVTITDQAGPGEAAKRTVSMIVADRRNGIVRSQWHRSRRASGRFDGRVERRRDARR